MKVCILDYGSGNVKSVFNSFINFSDNVKISNKKEDLENATHLVLPGVGSFDIAMEKINKTIDIDFLNRMLNQGIPFLGICVGMQVLAEIGKENRIVRGLGLLNKTEVIPISTNLPLPHIGWNNLLNLTDHPILFGINKNDNFYFVHSYKISNLDAQKVVASTYYGEEFPAIVATNNIIGVQFHPEKSQSSGQKIIRNFLRMSV